MKAKRETIAALNEENAALRERLELEKANSASLERSYLQAQKQIELNERAVKSLETAIALHEKTIGILLEREKELAKEVKKQKKRAVLATLLAVGTIASRFLL